MKTGILYYSETGNTEMIAQAILSAVPEAELVSVSGGTVPELEEKDLWFIGMPVHSDDLPDKMKEFFESGLILQGPADGSFQAGTRFTGKAAVFFTHTGPMEDESIRKFHERLSEKTREKGLDLVGTWHCRGENRRADVVEWLRVNMPDRYRNTLSAIGLPSQSDIESSGLWAVRIMNSVKKEAVNG